MAPLASESEEGDHARRVEHLAVAEAVAARAGAHGRVERKEARLQLRQRVVADRAGELGVEQVLLVGRARSAIGAAFRPCAQFQRDGAAFGQPQRRLEALGQALLHVGARAQPVDHHVDVVLLGLLELGQVVVFVGLAVDAETHIARGLHLGEELEEFAFLLARDGREDHQARFVGNGQRGIDHLRHGLRLQRQVVVGAVGRAGAGVQEAQVVMDLGHRAHGGARVVAGRLLLDADGGRQALDHVDVGLVHELQELPRIGREAFHVAPLAFGIERVEGQARFARARQAGDHHQLVARNVEVDILQVVGARTADADALLREHRAEVGVAFEFRVACALRAVVGVFNGFGIQGGDRPRATGHDSPSGISWRAGGLRRFQAGGASAGPRGGARGAGIGHNLGFFSSFSFIHLSGAVHMASVNKVIVVGNLGRDPEMRTFPSGDQVANVTVATTDRWKDKQSGEMREATEWHRIVFNGRLAEIAGQYLRKGSQVYVEGACARASGPTRTASRNTPPKSAPTRCRCWAAARARAAPRAVPRTTAAIRRAAVAAATRKAPAVAAAMPPRTGRGTARSGAGTAPGSGQVVVGLRRHGRRHSVLS